MKVIEIEGTSGASVILRAQEIPDSWTVEGGEIISNAGHSVFPEGSRWYPAPDGARDGDTYDPDTDTVTPKPGPSVEVVRARSLERIDEAAGEARARFITTSPGQESVYAMKREHATAYKAAGYTGDVPAMVAAEAAAQGMTATEAADFILATAAQWIQIAAAIEQHRQAGKTGIKAAATVEAIETIRSDAVSALDQIRP